VDSEAGVLHQIPRIDDSRLTEIFAREVLAFLVGRELPSPEWAERILSWRHTGFNVHGRVRVEAKPEAEGPASRQFVCSDFDPRSRLSFFRERRGESHAHGDMIANNMEKEMTTRNRSSRRTSPNSGFSYPIGGTFVTAMLGSK
jgi:hypothetical protein